MSSFASKRKARKITVQDDDEDDASSGGLASPLPAPTSESEPEPPLLQATFKSRKPFKQSSLRRSINVNEPNASALAGSTTDDGDEDEGTSSPVVRRPILGRSASTKSTKRQSSSSRLSFGPSTAGVGEDGDNDDGDSILLGEQPSATFTPKKPAPGLIQTASENSAIKRGMARNSLLPGLNRLAMRSADSGDDNDDGRPRYSKEYLSELQNSTPNTPQNIKTFHHMALEDDEMSLDPSELEGAMIVDTEPASSRASPQPGASKQTTTAVLTEAEIREKKERRARLAKQGGSAGDDFISLSDDDDSSGRRRTVGESYLTVLSRQTHHSSSSSKKKESRLRADDEDLGEGFDEFVDDGGLSLGRKAERAARRKQRADMASMIETAEGTAAGADGLDAEDSDDSEAERRAAYEKAQTRAGMDGLKRADTTQGNNATQLPPPKITPLPDLSVLAADFKAKMARKEAELQRMRARIDELRAERDGVLAREPEVQRLLNEAGERYRALIVAPATGTDGAAAAAATTGGAGENDHEGGGGGGIAAARSLLDRVRGGDTPIHNARGLDSLGTTPTRQPPVEMEF
ncbi:U2-type post-mRNA release spliceosomal complex [Microdochium nivale]|nr:U2-type post-mRNA release spliceosomal complex [Microdochium nivale]